MKFDKETVTIFSICIIILLGWTPFCEYMGWITPPKMAVEEPKKDTAQAESAKKVDSAATQDKTTQTPSPETKTVVVPLELTKLPDQILSNDLVDVTFSPTDGSIKSILLKKFLKHDKKSNLVLDDNINPAPLSVTWDPSWKLVDAKILSATKENLKVLRTFKKDDSSIVTLTQEWQLEKDYTIKYNIAVKNIGNAPFTCKDFTVYAGGLPTLHILAGDSARSEYHYIEWCLAANSSVHNIDASGDDKAFYGTKTDMPMTWTAVSNKYFASILIPEKPFTAGSVIDRYKIDPKKDTPDNFYLLTGGRFTGFTLEKSAETNFSFKYFAGPKEVSILQTINPTTDQIMHLSFWSWRPLEWISQWLLIALNYLKGLCGSYGWAIIFLTIIVKAVFWHASQKANNSMKKMQKIQPLVQEIKTKYKDNPQLMNVKVMELYKEQKVNPLGGCLPILLQMPVFIALYSTLDGAVELRHTSFMWCHDLSRPDTIFTIFGLLDFNPLILLMTALMVFQQKMTPASPDPVQQKMMMFMPIVMLIFMYSLPSGLTLYWTVNQIISILQLLINKKGAEPTVKPAAA